MYIVLVCKLTRTINIDMSLLNFHENDEFSVKFQWFSHRTSHFFRFSYARVEKEIVRNMSSATFTLSPAGDTGERKSSTDAVMLGSIPVVHRNVRSTECSLGSFHGTYT